MDVKVKTAALSTCLNILLTGIKFLLYFLTGSLAILAEAWHSFTDIATSLLVLVGVRRSHLEGRDQAPAEGAPAHGRAGASRLELGASLAIGLLLLAVALTLLRRFLSAEPRPIRNALGSGLLFILFSFGSYFISSLEIRVGRRQGSVGLVSDGLHARADMVSSLLTGFSLVLFSIGLDLDRWVAGLICLLILAFAVETITNVIRVRLHPDTSELFRYRSYQVLARAMEREFMRGRILETRRRLEAGLGPERFQRLRRTVLFVLPPLLLGGLYLSTALFTVGVREEAVVERFGRPLQTTRPVGPGLHLKLPWPVDRVRKVATAEIRELNIGNVTDRGTLALLWTRKHGTEEPFLSGDNNFFYPYIVLHYRVKDLFRFLYGQTDPEGLLRETAYRIATHLFAREAYYRIAASDRQALEEALRGELQATLDGLGSGLELVTVNFKDIHPPIPVADAFEKVIAGFQEKQRIINEALGYRNSVKPAARGSASARREAAEGYILDRRKRAEGDAARFLLRLPTNRREREIALSLLYLDTLSEGLRGKKKILVDPGAGVPDLWLHLEPILPAPLPGGSQR